MIPLNSSEFYKNAIFGLLIASFPFGQFFGAPIIGQLSDKYGRRKLLLISLIGTVATLLLCAVGVLFSMLFILLAGRFIGGLMAGNMTLAYASLADFSSQEEKVKNFALIPLATGLGFASGPYLAGILSELSGATLPFLLATLFAVINLLLVFWLFPETFTSQEGKKMSQNYLLSVTNLWKALTRPSWIAYLSILFLMISANFLFVQFVGPFAIDRFHIGITEVGYLYANIGLSVALGHLFLTRRLANRLSPEWALLLSLLFLGVLLIALLFSNGMLLVHIFTFFIMLACAVAYTNAMTLVSNQAAKEEQGEMMGVAVSIQSCSEFLPAALFGLVASFSQSIPLLGAAFCAAGSFFLFLPLIRRDELTKQMNDEG